MLSCLHSKNQKLSQKCYIFQSNCQNQEANPQNITYIPLVTFFGFSSTLSHISIFEIASDRFIAIRFLQSLTKNNN